MDFVLGGETLPFEGKFPDGLINPELTALGVAGSRKAVEVTGATLRPTGGLARVGGTSNGEAARGMLGALHIRLL